MAQLERLKLQAKDLAAESGLSAETMDHLIWRHGNELFDLKEAMQKYKNHGEKQSLWMAEAEQAIDQTCCLQLEDFYWRRSPLFLADKNHGLDYLDNIANVFAEKLSWTPTQLNEQKVQLKMSMQRELSWKSE